MACLFYFSSLVLMGGQVFRVRAAVGGADRAAAVVPLGRNQRLIIPLRPLSPQRFLHLTLNLSLTLISVVLCCGDNTTLLLAPFHWPSQGLQILFCILHPSTHYYLCRTVPTPILWRPKVVIMLSTGWQRLPSGSGRWFLRLSADFL
ncbi:hypothetical protein [Desmodus bat hepatitis E virus]|uniref:Uncharacterized protein n=1 Tax=Desmodus bat hepatitis E virus TaxID=3070191 RepID=A0AA49AFG1_9VIRU|nr:hypothetical protein QKS98_gp3 [Bat hepatitis E virus]QTE76059.1 hypothetical protein [Desmodus bat hepatitis E virus]